MRIIIILTLSGLAWLTAAANNQQPNVILIMADDLGQECIENYGGESYQLHASVNWRKRGCLSLIHI